MKKEIRGKEYNIKRITLGDLDEFSDFLKQEKLDVFAKFQKKANSNDVVLDPEFQGIIKQIGLSSNINIDVLKGLETALKRLQSMQDGIDKILSTAISYPELRQAFFSIKGMRFMIWLAIRDNGVKWDDMDSIIDGDNLIDVFNFIEIIGFKVPEVEEKNEVVEVENPSP